MGRRLSHLLPPAAAALVLAVAATAAAPKLHLVASAHGSRGATLKVTTKGLKKVLWLYRFGGVGVAKATGHGVCRAPNGAQTTWAASFPIKRNQRHVVWTRYDSSDCTFRIHVGGSGTIQIQLRGA